MRNIYFDLCSIPIYLLILGTFYLRKMNSGRGARVFLMMNYMSLLCAVTDVWMEFAVNPLPLSPAAVVLGSLISYTYLVVRNATLVVYLIFIFCITHTEHRIRPPWVRLLLWLPNTVTVCLLAANIVTHSVFQVTAQGGYARGPLMLALYITALLYGVAGTIYCVYCKRYLATGKWVALLSVYVFTFIAVFLQFFIPSLLVEMFSTAIGLLMIMLLVMRPEESVDSSVGVQSWLAYQNDLRNISLSNQHVQLVVTRVDNAIELRSYLGEDQYNRFISRIAGEIKRLNKRASPHTELYFEHPGTLYMILDDIHFDVKATVNEYLNAVHASVQDYAEMGVRFEPRICLIRYPEDLDNVRDVLNLGHKFIQLINPDQTFCQAADIVHSRSFAIVNNMEDILNRAITEGKLEMYYQPIYSLKQKRFFSAEALARINDSQYGIISPSSFIPAAENLGLILPLGEAVLESVFRFIATHDLEKLGLSYVEINLSVAQCMQRDLPDTVFALQQKYGISPRQVNFEITETLFDGISDVMESNLRALSRMGYQFSLDDYGIGYSNIQRLSRLPLNIIKIDKSLVDEMFSQNGQVIIQNTVRMIQGIHKELVIEGVETKEETKVLIDLSCDFIQGFYYSKPLPEQAFIDFLQGQRAG